MSLQPQRPRIFVWLTTLWASLRALAQTGWLLLAQASTWLRVQLAGWRRWGPGLQERALVIWAWVREELPRWRTWAPRLSRWSQAKALAAAAWYRIQTPARKALVVLLLLVTILTGPTGAVLIRSDIGQRLFGLPASTNRPSYDPTQSHLHLPPSPPITGKPGTARPPMPHAFAALPREVAADPAGFTFLSTDGRFEADVPAGAVTAQDLAGAAGHQEKLRVTQFAPASGGTAGGSGLISFGSYLVELVDGNGKRVGHGFHKPVDIHLHYAPQETVFNLDHAFVVFNGAHPKTISGLGAASSAPLTLDRVKRTLSTQIPVDPAFARNASTAAPVAAAAQSSSAVFNGAHSKTISGLGLVSSAALIVDHIKQALSTLISIIPAFSRNATLKPLGNATAATAATAATSGTPASWGISFNSTSPVAKFVNPDPFNVDLSSGSLNTAIPLDLPAGPAGHVPPLTLAYNSGGVSEQHNPQGAAGWVGEGWNLSLGAITWSERDYNEQCGTKCSQIWQNQWFLSDAFGTSTELLPPATNTSTYYDDTGNPYCAQGNSAAQPCPIQFHTADESYAKVYAYVGGNNYGNSNGLHTLCFRAYLANGIMEEFGCSLDSAHYDSLQYYVAGLCLGTYNCNSTGYYLPSAYYPDLITYPNGDQIHITYQSDTLKDPGSGAWYPRDTVLGTVEWDSPDCINASQACTVSWHPHYRVQFNASHSVARVTNTPANCNTTPGLRCDDPLDLSASGGLPAPAVNSTFVLNDFAVQTNLSGNGGNYSSGAWNTVRDYQLGYEVTGPKPITDAVTGKQQSVAGYLDLTQIQQVGTDNNTANGSPLTSFGYSDQNQYYEDGTLTPPSAAGCGPWGWNVGGNGNPCDLWAQSYESNNRYLSSADNHLGQTQTISWENARSNTHGVNAGGSNFDPLACDNYPASYPCDEADDQQWSRIIVGEHDSSVQQVTQQGQGGAQTSKTITTPYHYTYQLVSYNSNECADCGQGFYWGDENSNDSLDFYSPHFAGFAQTTVSKPDGSMETHKFYSSEGWGVYDASQFTGTNSSKCTVNVPPYTYCRQSSWWDLQNVGHGREYEADYYDTNGTTLLRKVTNQYQAVCPSPGGATSWNGKQASELGSQSNPVVGCDVQLQESTTAHYDGASADSSAAASTVNYYYDPTFGRPTRTVTTNNGGLTAQYFSDTTLTNLVCTRRDPDVNFSLGVGGWPGCGLASTGFSARWTGKVIPQYNETYTFYTLSDDGVRLWVNGQELVNNWTDHAPVENSGTITLTAGQAYDIKMEYYQNQGGATAALSWSSPSTSKQIVPATALQATSTTSNSSQSVDTYTTYIQNDGLTLPSSQLNNTVQEGAWGGTYLVDAVASKETYDPANNRVGCSYTWYDGAAYATGQQASLTHGNPTQKGTDTACSNYSGSLITKMSYDAYGNPVTSTDANNNTGCTANGVSATSCTTYGTVTLAQPTSAANALNQVTTTGYDTSAAGGFGLWPVSTTDPNNQTTTTTYDVLGRVSTIRLPGQTTGVPSTQLTYTFFPSCSGAQTVCYEVDAATRTDSATQVTQRRFYDGASRLVETRTPAPGGMDTVAYTLYDVSGRAYQTSSPYQVTAYTGAPDLAAYSLPDTSVPNTQTLYDGLDRVTQVQDPVGHKSYSSYSSVCNAAGTNDAACYSQTLGVDANGHQHGVLTDGLGRAIYAQDYTGNSGATYAVYRTTTTTYDTLGRAVAILHPDGTHSTTFTYDTAGRLTAMSDPDRGNESYSYDPNGNLTQTVDARGASGTIYTGYDSLNRQLWRNTTNSASGAYASYSYDSTANGNVGVGRLTGESFTGGLGASLNGSYAYTYDSLGRLTQQTQTTGNVVNCPAGWTCQGINNPTVGMNQFYSSAGVWTVQASGHGIGGTGDTFQYDYQSLPADGALSAQVTSGTVTNAYAKSGLMMRATTDTGSPYYFVLVRAQGTLEVQYRATVGGATTNLATISNVKAPIYLQITRSGTTFSAASSSDGVNWTTIAGSTVTIGAMTGTLLEGLAATANDTNRLGAFTFAHVSLSTTAPASSTYTTSNTYNDASQPISTTYANGDVVTNAYSSAGWLSGVNLTPSGSSTSTPLLSNITYSGQAGATGKMTGATLGANPNTLEDTFTRANQAGWGTSTNSDGVASATWGMDGTASYASVNNNLGVYAYQGSINQIGIASFGSATHDGGDALAKWSSSAVGHDIPNISLNACADKSCYYGARVNTSSNLLELAKRSGGSTTIESNTGFTIAANTSYWTRLNVNHSGSSTVVSVKIWQDGTNEPAGWTLTWTDTTPLAAGYVGAGGSWNQVGTGESISYACYAYSASPTTPAAACGEGKYIYNAAYDGLLRATDLKWTRASDGATRYDTQPSYDAVSNVTGVKTTLPQGTDNQAFCYDEQNRLTWAGSTGTPSCGASLTAGTLTAAQYSASYSYDTLDRLTASPQGSYTYGDSAHLHASTAIGPSGGTATWTTSYDASGNTACRAATTATTCAGTTPNGALLTYDNEGRLTAWQNIANVTTTPTSTPAMEEALYDGEGQRVQQIDESNTSHTTTQHTYVGGTEDIASQWANAGGAVTTTTTAYYASGLAQSVNGALSYTLGDGLGSVSASVNASGTVSASQLYGPYGSVRYQNGTLPTDYAFTHQRADATSGLDYYGARYYDPVAGQFTSADTTLAGGLNRFGYVKGNPETKTDPTGHIVWTPWTGWNTAEAVGSVVMQSGPQGIQYILQARAERIAMRGLNNAGQREVKSTPFTQRGDKIKDLLENEDFQSRSYKAGSGGMKQVDTAVEDARLVSGDAVGWARYAKWGGRAMLAAGFAIDLFTTHSQYVADHPEDPQAEAKGWTYGFIHGGLSTAGAIGGAALAGEIMGGTVGMLIPIPGVDIAAALVLSAAGAYAGDFVADQIGEFCDSGGFHFSEQTPVTQATT